MPTYKNLKYGFALDFPDGWQESSGLKELLPHLGQDFRDVTIAAEYIHGIDEILNIVVNQMCPELPPDVNDLIILKNSRTWNSSDMHFGRIFACEREHSCVSFVICNGWVKKYLIVVNGYSYAISGGCSVASRTLHLEKSWDQIASSFRLLYPIDPAVTELNSSPSLHQAIDRLRKELKAELNLPDTIIYL
jgi:hypothetical protein